LALSKIKILFPTTRRRSREELVASSRCRQHLHSSPRASASVTAARSKGRKGTTIFLKSTTTTRNIDPPLVQFIKSFVTTTTRCWRRLRPSHDQEASVSIQREKFCEYSCNKFCMIICESYNPFKIIMRTLRWPIQKRRRNWPNSKWNIANKLNFNYSDKRIYSTTATMRSQRKRRKWPRYRTFINCRRRATCRNCT
jgi:hypothetical protein